MCKSKETNTSSQSPIRRVNLSEMRRRPAWTRTKTSRNPLLIGSTFRRQIAGMYIVAPEFLSQSPIGRVNLSESNAPLPQRPQSVFVAIPYWSGQPFGARLYLITGEELDYVAIPYWSGQPFGEALDASFNRRLR